MCKLPILVGPQIFIFIAFYYTHWFSCFYSCLTSREREILVERYYSNLQANQKDLFSFQLPVVLGFGFVWFVCLLVC